MFEYFFKAIEKVNTVHKVDQWHTTVIQLGQHKKDILLSGPGNFVPSLVKLACLQRLGLLTPMKKPIF